MLSQPQNVKPHGALGGFEVQQKWIDRVVVLATRGDVDMVTAPSLEEAIAAVATREPEAIIVDLSGVDFLASAGMSALVTAHNQLAQSGRFAVVADGPGTSRSLKLVGLDAVLRLYPSVDEALNDLR